MMEPDNEDFFLAPVLRDDSSIRHHNPRSYSTELGNEILRLYADGYSLSKISRITDMPSIGSISRWITDHPEFSKKFESARLMRALIQEDRMEQIAEKDSIDKNDVPGERLKFDAANRLAEIANPAKYGKRTTVVGDESRPIVFQVITGVPPREITESTLPAEIIETISADRAVDGGTEPESGLAEASLYESGD